MKERQVVQLSGILDLLAVLMLSPKSMKKVLKNQLVLHLDETLSIASYIRSWHAICFNRMVEELRIKLDNDYIVGAVFMDLSKAIW